MAVRAPALSRCFLSLAKPNRWNAWLLTVIILLSTGLALRWVFLVPIYQAPDEPEHLDYALCIKHHGGLFWSSQSTLPDPGTPFFEHPYTVYLRDSTATLQLAFSPENRVPPGYGTLAYFAALERGAPPEEKLPAAQPPILFTIYPFGYYALLALWLKVLSFGHDGIVFLFFGARILSVLFLGCSLVLSYATLRLLNFKPWFGLALTGIIGFFPLTSFVSSYVQPDNLAFTLVSLCLYLALRWRSNGRSDRMLALLGLALGALLITKLHFYVCVLIPVVGMVGTTTGPRRAWCRAGALLLLPSAAAAAVHWVSTRGASNLLLEPATCKHPFFYLCEGFGSAVWDFYADQTHDSFWGKFGWLDTPLLIAGWRISQTVHFLTQMGTWIILALTLLRLEQVLSRLSSLAHRGRWKAAWRIAFSNPLLNSYFAFTVLMFFLRIATNNRFAGQGRNWLPFLLPIFLTRLFMRPKHSSCDVRRGCCRRWFYATCWFTVWLGAITG